MNRGLVKVCLPSILRTSGRRAFDRATDGHGIRARPYLVIRDHDPEGFAEVRTESIEQQSWVEIVGLSRSADLLDRSRVGVHRDRDHPRAFGIAAQEQDEAPVHEP